MLHIQHTLFKTRKTRGIFFVVMTFAIAGLFHGYAFGEAIAGAERAPLGAYLLGLVVVQSALTVGTALLARKKIGA